MPSSPPSPTSAGLSLSRRTALTAVPAAALPAAGLLGGAAAHAAPAPVAGPSAPSAPSEAEPIRLAYLADTHADPENAENMARLRATFTAIDAFDPHLVLHGGDVTEHGTVTEFEAFDAAIPQGLRERVLTVPGNHETRWDASAGELRQERIGQEVRHRDVDGLRIILADTTFHQQEVAWWSPRALDELAGALDGAGSRPCVLVTHFPMGEGFYYVANQQDFEDVLTARPIALHLTGHTHRELLTRVNRRDQLEAAAVKTTASWYELTGTVEALRAVRVDIPDPADPSATERTEVATFDLRAPQRVDRALPRRVGTTDDGEDLRLEVTLLGDVAASVDATLYDTTIYAGRNEELAWTPLEQHRGTFTGAVDAAALSPGRQRVHVRVRPDDGSGPRLHTAPFDRRERGTVWEAQLGGAVQGAPAVLAADGEELLVVGDASGRVTALDADGSERWTVQVDGEVRHDLVAVDGGTAVAVPDTAGALHVLSADGTLRSRYTTDAPVAADPGTGEIDGEEVLLVCAGTTLHAVPVSADEALWTAELPSASMGAPATDGERVVLGAGDGAAHALDARTGEALWRTSITTREGTYQRFIYGPWNDAVTVLPDGGVLVSGISDTWCVDPADGSARWRLEGSFQYAREALAEDGTLVMANEAGEIVHLDPADGTVIARHATAERVLDEGFVLAGGIVYTASHSGLITAVDLASGEAQQLVRLSTAPVLARGVAFGGLLVFGDLAGAVHALERV
jgi:outer membrane protein assembly factor BamB/predicted phosphodiesterase